MTSSVNEFADKLKTLLAGNHALESNIDLDLHLDSESSGFTYKTEICDRLSDQLKLSPASIAKPLVDQLKALGFDVTANNLGTIYFQSDADCRLETREPSAVVIYLQPPGSNFPAQSGFDLSYIKIVSQALLQVKFLMQQKTEFRLFVPTAQKIQQIQTGSFDEMSVRLLNLLRESAHLPTLSDLDAFNEEVRGFNGNITLWLTSAVLSLPKISDRLRDIKKGYVRAVNIYTQNLDPDWPEDLFEKFKQAVLEYQASACVYMLEVRHFNDLDWQYIEADNWLSLSHVLESFLARNKQAARQENKSRFRFLIANLPSVMQRAANNGGSLAAVRICREITESGHKLLNRDINLAPFESNSSYSLLSDLSNIIG